MRDIEVLLSIKKDISTGKYNDGCAEPVNTEHKIQPVMIIPIHTLDKIILDALSLKDKEH